VPVKLFTTASKFPKLVSRREMGNNLEFVHDTGYEAVEKWRSGALSSSFRLPVCLFRFPLVRFAAFGAYAVFVYDPNARAVAAQKAVGQIVPVL